MAPSPTSSFTFSLYFLTTLILTVVAFTEHNNTQTQTTSPPPTPIPQDDATSIPQQQHTFSTFKPSVAIVISVLTVTFSFTFLLLLYIKHFSTTTTSEPINIDSSSSTAAGISSLTAGRKNSGINRSVVESLPIFRFGSLLGQKDGLDCAVCLSKFESSEILRLLPKCKHAFHVECVDTWLEAHSTCPLCRYRVDPEDILLVLENSSSTTTSTSTSSQLQLNQNKKELDDFVDIERGRGIEYYRKRHSSVGEKEWERERRKTASFRWSLDSSRKKNENAHASVGIGIGSCFVGPRKDGMLLTKEETEKRSSVERRRLEHKIIVSPKVSSGVHRDQRWSDVQPCDLLYLTAEMMIMSESSGRVKNRNRNGRSVINSRSVSEITGFSRLPFSSNRCSSSSKQ
ncbi:RING-H2 finger protein ATL43-like [Cicer arietinum]|uniref:RING-type E3 ubiquitin transferase n=1 Tax=Cicer arietinum TaxID=3827 RepID=A0A1S2YAZ0_CICAR|nr:RING-H2 finger protein ATL43-like [Cicer arietinum]